MKLFRVLIGMGIGLIVGLPARAAAPTAVESDAASDESIRAVLRVVARHQMSRWGVLHDGDYAPVGTLAAMKAARKPTGIAWTYPWGVTLYGVIRSVDATGDRVVLDWALEQNRILARYYAWAERAHRQIGDTPEWGAFIRDNRSTAIARLLRLGDLDSCGAMGTEMLEAALRHPDGMIPEERTVLNRVAHWVAEQQERLPDGTLWRKAMTDEDRAWPDGTIWADDLYMSGPFLVRWAAFTGEDKFLTDAAHQVIGMAARLQDTDGLWFHAYSVPRQEHSPFKWGRANAWVLVTTAEILSVMPENQPDRATLLRIYRRHVEGLKKVQPSSGLWKQVLDRPDLWEETSCTAMFAYAIARGVNRGWLPAEDREVARKAVAAICSRCITPEGVVKGTCEGTGIGLRLEYYANRQRPDDDSHGPGVVLLAGTELLDSKRGP